LYVREKSQEIDHRYMLVDEQAIEQLDVVVMVVTKEEENVV
jgi:hypothetical protein